MIRVMFRRKHRKRKPWEGGGQSLLADQVRHFNMVVTVIIDNIRAGKLDIREEQKRK